MEKKAHFGFRANPSLNRVGEVFFFNPSEIANLDISGEKLRPPCPHFSDGKNAAVWFLCKSITESGEGEVSFLSETIDYILLFMGH